MRKQSPCGLLEPSGSDHHPRQPISPPKHTHLNTNISKKINTHTHTQPR